MTLASPDGGRDAQPHSRLLIARLPAAPGWIGDVPPAPPKATISTTVTDPTGAIRHAARLLALGYLPVGSATGQGTGQWVDFGVTAEVVARERSYMQELLDGGGRLLDPAMGPVRVLLGNVLRVHEDIVRPVTPTPSQGGPR